MEVKIAQGKGRFEGECVAFYCNQWGLVWRNCAKLREPMELSFGMVSRVGREMGVLDGSTCPKGKEV